MHASPASDRRRRALALLITGAAVFMVTLDNLVVTNALPSIRADLGATISQLGWFVNAYTLTFAALLLTGASLGDRFGRRRVFSAGLVVFTAGSLGAALASSSGLLIAARSVQGLGAALVMPLSLTLLSAAFPPERRGLAIGIWSGLSGLAVALGPVVGGAVVDGLSWQWIFLLNVPIGVVLVPFAYRVLDESHGPDGALDVRGLALASTGLFALVWGIVRGNDQGWTSPEILAALGLGAALLAAFVAWQRRAPAPMLPLHLFRSRAFSATNGVSLIMNFGIFGSIFLLAQFLQTVQGYSAFDAGVRTLPWTLMPMFVAPLAGAFSDRIGSRPLMATGLALQAIALAWLASVSSPTVAYSSLIAPFVIAGIGMALVFAPVSNTILSSVRRSDEGKASGANNAIREVGGALGIAVLASVFTSQGNTLSGQGFVDGLVPAVWIGAAVLAAGAVLALAVPGRRQVREAAAEAAPKSRRRSCPRSAHREHEGRARGSRERAHPSAQGELARVHDRERCGEAAGGVGAHEADAAPALCRERLEQEVASVDLGQPTADTRDRRCRSPQRHHLEPERQPARGDADEWPDRCGGEPHRRGARAYHPHARDAPGVRTHAQRAHGGRALQAQDDSHSRPSAQPHDHGARAGRADVRDQSTHSPARASAASRRARSCTGTR